MCGKAYNELCNLGLTPGTTERALLHPQYGRGFLIAGHPNDHKPSMANYCSLHARTAHEHKRRKKAPRIHLSA